LSLFAQTIVDVPSDVSPGSGNLNNAIQSAINGGTLSNTIFNLEPYGYYVLSGLIVVPLNEHLRITAPDPGTTQLTSPPQILWTADNSVATDYLFRCFGDLTLKNVWLRYADEGGVQKGSQIRFIGDTLGTAQVRGTFENVIFDYSPTANPGAGGSVTITANHFVGHFTNCYWKNCIDTHLRYYGRAVSFPYQTTKWHIDSLTFENCTFANMGYVIMQESPEYIDHIYLNHCTFHNIMMWSIEALLAYKASITNCLWVNGDMYGYRLLDVGNKDSSNNMSGTIFVDSLANYNYSIEFPFTEQDRRILFANNSYYNEKWLTDWQTKDSPWAKYLHANRRDDEIPQPKKILGTQSMNFLNSPDFPYMNSANLYFDSLTNAYDPGFVLPPTAKDSLKIFLNKKWDDNSDINWAWQRDDGWYQTWPLNEDLSYTNATLKTAAMGGYPLGDLYRWWPTEYSAWQAQKDAEYSRIYGWMESGTDPAVGIREITGNGLPSKFELGQNYPNPFNPTTEIEYSIPKSGHVSLVVFNDLGQEIAVLFNGSLNTGNYTATFDGSGLASGVYYYQLQSENVTITKKLVLMK